MARWEGNDVRVELPRVTEAHVRIVGGEVAVTAGSGPARVEAEVLAGPPIKVSLDAGVLTVKHQADSWLGRISLGRDNSVAAVVTLTIPADASLMVQTVSADTVVAGVRAGAGLAAVSGRITATDVGGELRVNSVSGDVEAQDVDGSVSANTVSGRVTVTGDVPTLKGHSVSGEMTFNLDNAPEASISTVSGDVLLRLPSDATLHLDLSTRSGHLDSAFPHDGTTGRRHVSGDVGAGGSTVAIHTLSGDVAILRKERAGVDR